SYGFEPDEEITKIYSEIRKTHNQGVFDAYTPEMRAARKSGIITGLPDAYGRGRIIGDYRRVALYGIDFLMAERKKDLAKRGGFLSESDIRDREELSEHFVPSK
ncbi:pyruvate formate lyase family protein, partial [Enterococcus faecium]|uniref:pyruvate formate lyase family protein n=1 Tax=Enterococcus faecium TaxID=1352 RepID=UPI00396E7DFA